MFRNPRYVLSKSRAFDELRPVAAGNTSENVRKRERLDFRFRTNFFEIEAKHSVFEPVVLTM